MISALCFLNNDETWNISMMKMKIIKNEYISILLMIIYILNPLIFCNAIKRMTSSEHKQMIKSLLHKVHPSGRRSIWTHWIYQKVYTKKSAMKHTHLRCHIIHLNILCDTHLIFEKRRKRRNSKDPRDMKHETLNRLIIAGKQFSSIMMTSPASILLGEIVAGKFRQMNLGKSKLLCHHDDASAIEFWLSALS